MGNLIEIADTAGFALLGPGLARDVRESIVFGLSQGAAFDVEPEPLTIFRQALRTSIQQIEADRERFKLFQRFLRDGPYENHGDIPAEIAPFRLSDDETSASIRFIYYHVINTFQGAIAELLAVGPCARLIEELRSGGLVPAETRIHVGDTVRARTQATDRMAKGADIHILAPDGAGKQAAARLVGLVEVKSYILSDSRLFGQIERHIRRAARGVTIRTPGLGDGELFSAVPAEGSRLVKMAVVPAGWHLPRTFRLKGGEFSVDPPTPPEPRDLVERVGDMTWKITLRWSYEALASAAYEMTFWLMGELGTTIYTDSRPSAWADMEPDRAGRNAAKMMLYYAILRCRTAWESRRAIALYNAYGFGYALGANFKDEGGRRAMLWFDDLEEIAVHGQTKRGGYLDGNASSGKRKKAGQKPS